jgi:hypothetical protein
LYFFFWLSYLLFLSCAICFHSYFLSLLLPVSSSFLSSLPFSLLFLLPYLSSFLSSLLFLAFLSFLISSFPFSPLFFLSSLPRFLSFLISSFPFFTSSSISCLLFPPLCLYYPLFFSPLFQLSCLVISVLLLPASFCSIYYKCWHISELLVIELLMYWYSLCSFKTLNNWLGAKLQHEYQNTKNFWRVPNCLKRMENGPKILADLFSVLLLLVFKRLDLKISWLLLLCMCFKSIGKL